MLCPVQVTDVVSLRITIAPRGCQSLDGQRASLAEELEKFLVLKQLFESVDGLLQIRPGAIIAERLGVATTQFRVPFFPTAHSRSLSCQTSSPLYQTKSLWPGWRELQNSSSAAAGTRRLRCAMGSVHAQSGLVLHRDRDARAGDRVPEGREPVAGPKPQAEPEEQEDAAEPRDAGDANCPLLGGQGHGLCSPGPEEPCRTPCSRPPMTKHDAANAELGPGTCTMAEPPRHFGLIPPPQ